MLISRQSNRIIVGTMVRDGYIYGLSLLVVAALVAWATGTWAWAIAPIVLAAFFLWFFRDPHRAVPTDPGLIVSPADGLVTEATTISTPEGPRKRISIFLSVFDVHVNRAPIAGELREVQVKGAERVKGGAGFLGGMMGGAGAATTSQRTGAAGAGVSPEPEEGNRR